MSIETTGLADIVRQHVLDWVRERIAGCKLPKSVDFIEMLPRNPTGKILKRELRKSCDRQRQVN
jgi:long-chain acyl-CoA synthetase